MKNDKILDLEKRRVLYNYISNHPGIHLREVKRRINMPYGTLRYHLGYLCKNELIEARKQGRFLRYYKYNNIGINDKKLLNVLRQVPMRKVILVLFMYTSCSLTELTKHIKYHTSLGEDNIECYDRSPSSLIVHLKKLVDMDIIECDSSKREVSYTIKDYDAVFRILIAYEDSFFDAQVSAVVNWITMWTKDSSKDVSKNIDSITDAIYEVMPHPYHV